MPSGTALTAGHLAAASESGAAEPVAERGASAAATAAAAVCKEEYLGCSCCKGEYLERARLLKVTWQQKAISAAEPVAERGAAESSSSNNSRSASSRLLKGSTIAEGS
ncbi:hypothetical protein CLOM_g1301 [Closterium sp. NIES-68]|nr:hypothetical protein CLOM_g1301 [Closterium sp. NIES-68]GJP61852.1 hypothetical protein CLOP_g18974 [Closterium sp. NIES-67]